MNHQLYQLRSKHRLPVGAYVAVNGPHDKFGVVQKSEPSQGGWLNLIRGVPARAGEKPVAVF